MRGKTAVAGGTDIMKVVTSAGSGITDITEGVTVVAAGTDTKRGGTDLGTIVIMAWDGAACRMRDADARGTSREWVDFAWV